MLEAYEQLKSLVLSIDDDIRKAAGGNKAAGTRVRKHMQDIKNKAQELRVKVLEGRGAEGTGGAGDAESTPETGGDTTGTAGA